MKYFIIFLFIAFVSCKKESKTECDYITNYYQKLYQADVEFEIENYKKAFEIYQEAFNSCKPINTEGYNELTNFAETCAILGKNALAIEYIKKQIARGYEIKWFQQNENFDKIFASEEGKKLISEYDYLRNMALSKINLSLREEIKQMKIEDQKYRNDNFKVNINNQVEIDTYNTNRIIEIFNEFGYPDETVIGSYAVDQAPVHISGMLLHTSDSIRMNYFVPKLTEFVKRGTCSPSTLGNIIDQYYLYNDQAQVYGTYHARGGGYANMIDNLKKVDSNRISIGLPPLELKEKKDSILKVRYPELF
jgi:tetratricopeptide (TPR) repeat protein